MYIAKLVFLLSLLAVIALVIGVYGDGAPGAFSCVGIAIVIVYRRHLAAYITGNLLGSSHSPDVYRRAIRINNLRGRS